jgi:hypothetical protein
MAAVDARPREVSRRDADDFVPLAVQLERCANDAGSTAKTPLPETVTDDHDVLTTRLFLFCQKRPALSHLDANRRKKVCRNEQSLHTLRLADAGEVRVPRHQGADAFERRPRAMVEE